MTDPKDNNQKPDRDPRRIPDGQSEYEKKSEKPGDLERRGQQTDR